MPKSFSPAELHQSSHTEQNNDNSSPWGLVAKCLQGELGNETFERWFKGAELILNGDLCEVILESDTHLLWVETNFSFELQKAVSATLDIHTPVSLSHRTLIENPSRSKKSSSLDVSKESNVAEALPEKDVSAIIKRSGLNPVKSFDNYVVGTNNQFAHAACHAIVSGNSRGYNPLFVHCPPGLGKTHLVQALGQEILRANPKKKVCYLTGEKFTNKYIEAVRKGTTDAFRKRYRKVDVLILDDIQFLAGKGKSQEEFFHTFNTLLETQGQVVLTSDRPANEIQTFDSRLSSRFEAGLTVSLAQPDFETRAAILQCMLKAMNVKVPDEAVHYIAEKVKTNVRRLEGALVRAATHCSLAPDALTIPTLEGILADILRQENTQRVTIDRIQKEVAEHFDIRLADMTSRKRPANIARARQIAMYLSREMTPNSLVDIGENFGGRDHGTVIHACKKVQGGLITDDYMKGEVQFLKTKLLR